jgi:hypothetical protein
MSPGDCYLFRYQGGSAKVRVAAIGLLLPNGITLPGVVTVKVLELQAEFWDWSLLVGDKIDVYPAGGRFEPLPVEQKGQLALGLG